MKIRKHIEIRINIDDSKKSFTSDYNKMLIDMLKDKYSNICYKGILILDIIKIIRRSLLNCKAKELDGGFYCDVIVEVEGIIYEVDEVIHNCRIIHISNNTLYAENLYGCFQIINDTKLDIFKKNDIIPIQVIMTRYNIFNPQISATAKPYIPYKQNPEFYRITSLTNLKEEDVKIKGILKNNDFIKFIYSEIESIIKNLNESKKNNKEVYKYFVNLIYPFKKELDYQKQFKSEKFNIMNIFNIEDILIDKAKLQVDDKENYDNIFTYPQSLLDNDTFYIVSDTKILNTIYTSDEYVNHIYDINLEEFIKNILLEYKKKLLILDGFITVYDSLDKIKEYKYLWKVYNMFQT